MCTLTPASAEIIRGDHKRSSEQLIIHTLGSERGEGGCTSAPPLAPYLVSVYSEAAARGRGRRRLLFWVGIYIYLETYSFVFT